MNIAKSANTFIGMLTLKKGSYTQASKNGFLGSVINFFLVALAVGLGTFFLTFEILGLVGTIVFGTIFLTLGYFVGVLVFWVFAKLFGGQAGYMSHYNGASFLALMALPNIIPIVGPFLSMLTGLWGIVMHIFLVREIHKLSTGKAVAAVLIPYLLLFILFAIIVFVVIGILMAAGVAFGSGMFSEVMNL